MREIPGREAGGAARAVVRAIADAGAAEGVVVNRTRVKAERAVALAGEFSGVYPRASPGGWRLLGTTALTLWDVDRDPPALLTPGTTVRFVDVTRAR